jgi:hypothetical protein
MKQIDPVAIGGLILSSIITPLNLSPADQDFVEGELTWLFYTADHFLKLRRGEIKPDQPIATPIPTDAEKIAPEANNQILLSRIKNLVKDWSVSAGFKSLEEKVEVQLSMWEDEMLTMLDGITNYLNYLNIQLDEETKLGETARYDLPLQNKIKEARLKVAQTLQEMALLIREPYGIYVTSPGQLVELLTS